MMNLSRPFVMPGLQADVRIPVPDVRHERWRSAVFRWFVAYAVIFSVAFTALLGLIEYSVNAAMQRETDSGLRWQLRYFDGCANNELAKSIDARIRRQARQSNYYGLFAPDGRRLAGDLRSVPPALAFERYDRPHDQEHGNTLRFDTDAWPARMRAMGEVRADGSRLVVARTLDDVRRVRVELQKALIVGGCACLLGGLVAGLLFSVRQMRRVADIRRATSRIAGGDLAQRLPVSGQDEFDMLAQLVNQMLDEVEHLVDEVKGACDVVAHDLRTPLVRLKLRLAALAESPPRSGAAAADVAGALAAARDDAEVILGRFAALLRISEIGSLARRRAFSSVALDALVTELCDLYTPLADERRITLTVDIENVGLVWADRALLFEAFTNLLDNAIKFTPDGGQIRVRLCRLENGPQFSVVDSGPGIPEEERQCVLTRYYRSERTRHVPGTGLGLGIVAAVVRLHDFRLSITDADGPATGAFIRVDCWPLDS
jgi:signal transduction histidine kinase